MCRPQYPSPPVTMVVVTAGPLACDSVWGDAGDASGDLLDAATRSGLELQRECVAAVDHTRDLDRLVRGVAALRSLRYVDEEDGRARLDSEPLCVVGAAVARRDGDLGMVEFDGKAADTAAG